MRIVERELFCLDLKKICFGSLDHQHKQHLFCEFQLQTKVIAAGIEQIGLLGHVTETLMKKRRKIIEQ